MLDLDESNVISWSADRTIRIWNLESGEEIAVLRGHEDAVTACDINGLYIVSGGADTTVRVWEISSGALLATLPGHTGPVTSLALQPKGDLCASSSLDRTIRVWRLEKQSSFSASHLMAPSVIV